MIRISNYLSIFKYIFLGFLKIGVNKPDEILYVIKSRSLITIKFGVAQLIFFYTSEVFA